MPRRGEPEITLAARGGAADRLGPGACGRHPGKLGRGGEEGLGLRLVRPGGRLIYATCSLLREEDEAQAEAFLAATPDFSLLPVARVWAETIGGASPGGEDYLRLTPARHGTDGFFIAIFERQPCPTAS